MVSSEEISRRLELKRKGVKPDDAKKSQYKPKSIGNEKPIEKKMICPKCQTENLETSKYCIGCGYELNSVVAQETDEDFILCPECNSQNSKDSKFCIKCGNELPLTNSIICSECNSENTTTSKFCIGCGAKLGVPTDEVIEEVPVDEAEKTSEISLEIKEKITEDEQEISEEEPQKDENELEDEEADLLDKIKKAKELLDIGAISEEEYEKIKDRYLQELNQ